MNATYDPVMGIVFDGQAGSPTILEKLAGRLRGRGSWTHWALLRRAQAAQEGPGPRFLLRVDDFPRWDYRAEKFLPFHRTLREAAVPYLLGVIPRPAENPFDAEDDVEREWTREERDLLREVAQHAEIALHGWSHRRRPGDVAAEIVGCEIEVLSRRIQEGLSVLHGAGLRADAYIPPFNAVDVQALGQLQKRFDVVLGGPESVRWLGCLGSPCRLKDLDLWFVPSYPPAYGQAGEAARFVKSLRGRRLPILVPITVHWAWEQRDGLEGLRRLAGALAGKTVTLSTWLDGRAWNV